MTERRIKRPRDPLQLAKLVGDIATGELEDRIYDGKDVAASELGRLVGMNGGRARAETLSKERRSEIASQAARARWKKDDC